MTRNEGVGEIGVGRKLLTMAVELIAGSSLLVGGGTYAMLNPPSNQFTTTTVNISAPGTTSTDPIFYEHVDFLSGQNPYDVTTGSSPSGELPGGFAPGEHVSRTWTIQNTGSAGKVTNLAATLDSVTYQNGANVVIGSQTYKDFLNYMRIAVYSPDNNYATPVFNGTFQQLISGSQSLSPAINLPAGGSSNVKFVASMDINAGNDLQGVKGVLDFSATATQTCQPFGYDIFSASDTQDFKVAGSSHVFDGPVHVNGTFTETGSSNQFNQVVEVGSTVTIHGSNPPIKNLVNPATQQPLPQIDGSFYQTHATQVYNSDLNLSGSNITVNGIWYVNGNVHISGSHISGNGTIVATGSIQIDGTGLTYMSGNDLVAFYSMQDIKVAGNNETFDGIFYAPNGTINISGSGSTFDGSLIGQYFNITGSKDHFEYDPRCLCLTVNQ